MNAQAISPQTQAHHTAVKRTGFSGLRMWSGRVLFGMLVLFLLMDGTMKVFKAAVVVKTTTLRLGYPESTIVSIGIVLLCCTALYVVPRTAVLGAILLTGYLGGAVASNIRAATPIFNAVFPCLFTVAVWASLLLRDKRVESVFFRSRVDGETD